MPDSGVDAGVRDILRGGDYERYNLRGASVLVTGATGFIGGAIVRALSELNSLFRMNIRLTGVGRDEDKGKTLAQNYGMEFISGDIRDKSTADAVKGGIDYIFHCAAITKSADMASRPVDVITTMVDGTRNMLELARGKQCEGFVYLSSMEVYGRTEQREVREGDLGYLDLSIPRSAYPESKRLCETLCLSYAAQYGVPVKTARLAQTFGPGVPMDDTRVFAQFARSAMSGADIILHTEGTSRGNYCHTADAVRGLLTVLSKGKIGEAYNVSNPAASMTVRQMAGLVAHEICGGNIKVEVKIPEDIDKYGYAPDARYTLSADKLKALGWTPEYGLADMYRHMIAEWLEQPDILSPYQNMTCQKI